MAYEIEMHHAAAGMLARGELPADALKISTEQDCYFVGKLGGAALEEFDAWMPKTVCRRRVRRNGNADLGRRHQGDGAPPGVRPHVGPRQLMPDVGIGVGIAETDRAFAFAAAR